MESRINWIEFERVKELSKIKDLENSLSNSQDNNKAKEWNVGHFHSFTEPIIEIPEKYFIPNIIHKKRKKIYKKKEKFIIHTYQKPLEHIHLWDWWENNENWMKCKRCSQLKKIEKTPIRMETSTYQEEYKFTLKTRNNISISNLIEFNKYKRKTFRDPVICSHRWILDSDTLEYFCKFCMSIYVYIVDEEERNNKQQNLKIYSRVYDRARWNNNYLLGINGKLNSELNDQTWLYIMREVPNVFNWIEVFWVFRKYNLNQYWTGFGVFIGIIPKINKRIVDQANLYTNHIKEGKYRIPYLYLIYKFTQIYNEEYESTIPIKMSNSWLKKADLWWKGVCEKDGLVFKESRMHKLSWDKKYQLENFVGCLKRLGLNTRI